MFLNYDKIVRKLVENNVVIEMIANKTSELIAKKICDNEDFVKGIAESLTISSYEYDNLNGKYYTKEVDLTHYVGEKVAGKLIPDVYELQKAQVLQEVHKEGVLNILHSKLEEKAKQHVLDFITEGNTNNRNGRIF
jgi:hypothetical protein